MDCDVAIYGEDYILTIFRERVSRLVTFRVGDVNLAWGLVGSGVWRQYNNVGMHKRIDVVWICSDVNKGLFSLGIGKSGTRLTVGISGKGYMFWIVSQCFAYAFA